MARAQQVVVAVKCPVSVDRALLHMMDLYLAMLRRAFYVFWSKRPAPVTAPLLNEAYHALRRLYPDVPSRYASIVCRDAAGLYRAMRKRAKKVPSLSKPVLVTHTEISDYDFKHMFVRVKLKDGWHSYRFYPHPHLFRYLEEGYEPRPPIFVREDAAAPVVLVIPMRKRVVPYEPRDVIGVDINVRNVTLMDGRRFRVIDLSRIVTIDWGAFKKARALQRKYQQTRPELWKKLHSKVWRRRTQRIEWVLRNVARDIVALAEAERAAIALENLKHMKFRVRRRGSRPFRGRLARWAARKLQEFIAHAAAKAGVPVTYVNPAHTSDTCPVCGGRMRSDLSARTVYCPQCGIEVDRDALAALNIRLKALRKMGGGSSAPDSPRSAGESTGRARRSPCDRAGSGVDDAPVENQRGEETVTPNEAGASGCAGC